LAIRTSGLRLCNRATRLARPIRLLSAPCLGPPASTVTVAMCTRIAGLRPLWEPGTATGYHAVTFGYVLGEIVRRVTGRPISQVLREHVAVPLDIADDLFFGVPAGESDRVARLSDGNWPAIVSARADDSLFFRAAPHAIHASADLGNRPELAKCR
jgi:CubicO group peptidase (beta-lactamase class C family)